MIQRSNSSNVGAAWPKILQALLESDAQRLEDQVIEPEVALVDVEAALPSGRCRPRPA